MTEYRKKITKQTADAIAIGRAYDYFYPPMPIRRGDVVTYEVWKDNHKIHHAIKDRRYRIIEVDRNAPQLLDGVSIATIKEIIL